MDAGRVVKGKKFNAGGQGSVWAVENRTINGSWPVAYKEYHTRIRPALKADVLSEMTGFVPSLPRGTGRWLAECTAWPAVLVTDSAGVSGFLMRQIPERFFRRFAFDPDKPQPAGFQYLLNPPAYFQRAGFSITPRQRFELLLDLAGTLVRLHSLGAVVGDVSPNNVLFCLDGTPSCFLIDCDAMSLHGKWALPAVETPNWGLPPGERMGGAAGDTYKFALLAARLFAGEQDGRDVTVLRAADQAVGLLAEQSLSVDPARRPVLEQWLGALADAVTTAPTTLPQPPFGPPGGTAPPTRNPGQPQHPTPLVPNTPPPNGPVAGKSKAGRRFAALVLLVLAVVYGPDLYDTLGDGSRPSDASSTGLSEESSGSGGPDSSTQGTKSGQVRSLAGLLERNEGNRSDVGAAVSRMTTCPGSSELREIKHVFDDAATERDALVQDLKDLDPDLLSSSMTADLRSGWQASADADRAYALLAEKVVGGCTSRAVMSSSHWRDASRASTRATRAKKDFVAAWNPLAEEHGLTTMSWDEV
ncbi:hypothetical protein ACIRJR_35860 [Streptomyces sp. NPDC102402]|uniref:hypothetical protein n=1 Tax=Streptomyces sp. NPDC102402 TaxID=3366169 RepID=UPI00380F5D7F